MRWNKPYYWRDFDSVTYISLPGFLYCLACLQQGDKFITGSVGDSSWDICQHANGERRAKTSRKKGWLYLSERHFGGAADGKVNWEHSSGTPQLRQMFFCWRKRGKFAKSQVFHVTKSLKERKGNAKSHQDRVWSKSTPPAKWPKMRQLAGKQRSKQWVQPKCQWP